MMVLLLCASSTEKLMLFRYMKYRDAVLDEPIDFLVPCLFTDFSGTTHIYMALAHPKACNACDRNTQAG